jgi:D-alanyl-D-alanine carboxypeptidase
VWCRRGHLSYDEPLSKFLPDYPDAESAQKIQIKHLLTHTAGLGWDFGYLAQPDFDSPARVRTVRDYIDMAERKPAAFEPGTKAQYSNIGFVLLGRILEIVTGDDYYDHMQKYVFAPAGATSASFPLLPANGVAVIPMASPYEAAWDQESLRETVVNQLGKDYARGGPAGGGVASALDLLKLSNAMNAGRIVRPETLRLHSTPEARIDPNDLRLRLLHTRQKSRPPSRRPRGQFLWPVHRIRRAERHTLHHRRSVQSDDQLMHGGY